MKKGHDLPPWVYGVIGVALIIWFAYWIGSR